jgi:hypothetical protein
MCKRNNLVTVRDPTGVPTQVRLREIEFTVCLERGDDEIAQRERQTRGRTTTMAEVRLVAGLQVPRIGLTVRDGQRWPWITTITRA